MDILDDFDDFTVQSTYGGGAEFRVDDYDLGGLGLVQEDDFLMAPPTTAVVDTQNLFSIGLGAWKRNATG